MKAHEVDWDDEEDEDREKYETRHERDRLSLQYRSCLIFPAVSNSGFSVRLTVFNLTHHRAFEILIVLLILSNCVILAMDDPELTAEEKPSYQEHMEFFFTASFAVELLLKVYSQGFVFHPGSYLRTGWNRLDALIVALSFLTLVPQIKNVTSLRVLRVLRPLRSINGIQGLKNIINGLLQSLKKLVNVMALAAFVFSIFGILGVQLWSGKFTYRCERIRPEKVCLKVESYCCLPPTSAVEEAVKIDRANIYGSKHMEYSSLIETISRANDEFISTATDIVTNRLHHRGDPTLADWEYYMPDTIRDEVEVIVTPIMSLHRPPPPQVERNVTRLYPEGFCCFSAPNTTSCDTYEHNQCGCHTEGVLSDESEIQSDVFCSPGAETISAFGWIFGRGCNAGYHCVDTGINPNHGFTSFDHFGYAVLIVFQCLTLEGWVDIMYIVQDVSSDFGCIYFILLVLLGSYFVLNLALAVINEEFDKIAKEAEAMSTARLLRVQRRQERALLILLQDAKMQQQKELDEKAAIKGLAAQHPKPCATPLLTERDNTSAAQNAPPPSRRAGSNASRRTIRTSSLSPPASRSSRSSVGADDISSTDTPPKHTLNSIDNDDNAEDEKPPHLIPMNPLKSEQEKEKEKDNTEDGAAEEKGKGGLFPPVPLLAEVPERKSVVQIIGEEEDEREAQEGQEALVQEVSEELTPLHAVLHYWAQFRWGCYRIVTHPHFTPVIIFFIVLNTALLASEHHEQPQELKDLLEVSNYILTGIFAIEMIVKVIASGPLGYLKDPFNVLDGAVVVVSSLELFTFSAAGSVSVFRAFRLLRVFKLLKNFKELRDLVEVILAAVSDTGYLNVIILLYIFCAALVGMQYFGGQMKFSLCDELEPQQLHRALPASSAWPPVVVKVNCEDEVSRPRSTFDSFYWSIITVFQVLTRDDWVEVMWDSMRATHPALAVYFLILVVCGDFVVLNLFLAILIQSFDQNMRIETEESEASDSDTDEGELFSEEEPPPPPPEEAMTPRSPCAQNLRHLSRRRSVEEAACVLGDAELLIKAGVNLDVLVDQLDLTNKNEAPAFLFENLKADGVTTPRSAHGAKRSFRRHPSQMSARSKSVRSKRASRASKRLEDEKPDMQKYLSLRFGGQSSTLLVEQETPHVERHSSLATSGTSHASYASLNSRQDREDCLSRKTTHESLVGVPRQLSFTPSGISVRTSRSTIAEVQSTGSQLETLDSRHGGGDGDSDASDVASTSTDSSFRHFVQEDYDHCPRCNHAAQFNTLLSKKRHAEVHSKLCTSIQIRKVREARIRKIQTEAQRLAETNAPFHAKTLDILLADAWEVGLWLDMTHSDFELLSVEIRFRKEGIPGSEFGESGSATTPPFAELPTPDMVSLRSNTFASKSMSSREKPLERNLSISRIGLEIKDTVVTVCNPMSSAYDAGMRKGDIVISINGASVVDNAFGEAAVNECATGSWIVVRVKRLRNWTALEYLCREEMARLSVCAGEEVFGGALVAFVNGNRIKPYRTNGGNSLFIFGPENPFRVLVCKIVKNPFFDRFILFCILLSSVFMAMEDPKAKEKSTLEWSADVTFAVLFFFEMLLKVVAFGFLFGGKDPDPPYLKDRWNILDFTIVVFSALSLTFQNPNSELSEFRVLRAFRALRPLRVISRNRGLRMVVITLLRSISSIGNVAIITFIVFLVFGILGVQLLKGKMHECSDPLITNRLACTGHFVTSMTDQGVALFERRHWRPGRYGNFDNIGWAMLTLFEVATLELWTKIMYQSIDAVSVDEAPQRDHNMFVGLFFVGFVVIGSFFILNLFVGFVIFNFAKVKAEEDGTGAFGVTAEQKLWLETQTMMLNFKPIVKMQSGKGRWRKVLHKITTSYQFEIAISVCILLNVFVMGLDSTQNSENWTSAIEVSNYFFSGVFFIEACMKGLAFGKSYLKDPWNRFDFSLVILSILQVVLVLVAQKAFRIRGYILRVFRVFRVLRILRLVKKAKDVRILLETISYSLPHIANIGAFLCLLFFIFAVLGVGLFANVQRGKYLNRHANFESFPGALLLLIRIVTGENWNGIMHETMVQEPECDDVYLKNCGTTYAPLYYLAFLMMATFILTNLFVAIILDNFRTTILIEKSNLRMTDLHKFIVTWASFDPDATCHIPSSRLPFLLEAIGPPLGIRSHDSRIDILNRTKSYCIPEHGGVIHFIETLIPLARQVLVSDSKIHYTELRNQEGKWRQAFPDINDLPLLRFRQRRCTVDQYFSSTYIAAAYRRSCALRYYSVQVDNMRRRQYAWRHLHMPEVLTSEQRQLYGDQEDDGTDSSGDAQQVLTLPTEFAPETAPNTKAQRQTEPEINREYSVSDEGKEKGEGEEEDEEEKEKEGEDETKG